MRPICVFNGNMENFNIIKSVYQSAIIKSDGEYDCIWLSESDYAKFEKSRHK